MTIEEASQSLKLECALRDIGFIEIRWQVIAHAGLYFVAPVTFTPACGPKDDLLGFQLLHDVQYIGLHLGMPLLRTAKEALDYVSI
jgi:hypothetical protein